MGHNTTHQAAASRVRAQKLADYRDWLLAARCERCHRQAVLRIDQLAQRWLDKPVSAALMQLRCQVCGKGPSAVRLERQGKAIVLIGPGSY